MAEGYIYSHAAIAKVIEKAGGTPPAELAAAARMAHGMGLISAEDLRTCEAVAAGTSASGKSCPAEGVIGIPTTLHSASEAFRVRLCSDVNVWDLEPKPTPLPRITNLDRLC